MQQLRDELQRVLEANPQRGVSTPPKGEQAAAPLTYNGGNSSLVWRYYSPGDYDQNGFVNVSDLTPLGQNFGKTAQGGSFPENSIEAVVDGDGNGEINLADVTPIGVNFGVQCSGYNIYVAENETAVPPTPDAPNGSGASLVDSVAFSSANLTGGRKSFTLQVVPTALQQQFWVRPTDGTLDGAASNAVAVNLPPAQPPQAAITPTGDTSTMAHIVWDASASFDPDGEIVSYEWDFDGDGKFDYTTDGSKPTADFYYYEAGQFSATVQVTDDTQRTDTATAIVNITQVQDWQETMVDERLDVVGGQPDGIRAPIRLMEVDGRPAMIYIRKQEADDPHPDYAGLTYMIAEDSEGDSWSGIQYIDVGTDASFGDTISFYGAATMVDGLPAAVYQIYNGNSSGQGEFFINFKRARNPEGSSWTESTAFYSDRRTDDSIPVLQAPRDLLLIGGKPAILGDIGGGLDYARATTINGSAWAAPESSTLSLGYYNGQFSYSVLTGKLARVEQINSEDLVFNRTLDDTADSWSDPSVLIDEHEKAQTAMRLLEVGGRAAVVYKEAGSADLRYRRAIDAAGNSWNEPVTLDPRAGSGRLATIIDGRPVVLYSDRISNSLKFISANDQQGTYWNFPADVPISQSLVSLQIILGSTNDNQTADRSQLADIGGLPAFTYVWEYEDESMQSGKRLFYIGYN
ncbi:PKD domain-containing protein [bacterium]|nr:PKD domain-containing protein [bacterium]